MFKDHFYLKYLINKPVFGGEICRWLILFQEFEFEIIVKPDRLNAGLGHLSRREIGEELNSLDNFLPDAQLFVVKMVDGYFEYIIHFLSTGRETKIFSTTQKKQLVVKAADFQLIAGLLYKLGPDAILHRCALEHEQPMVLVETNDGVERATM